MTPPRRRARTATLLLIANFKIIRRGRRPRRPVQPRTTTQLPGGVLTPSYEPTQKPSPPKNRNPAQSPGASRTPPPTRNHTRDVGASIARPQESRVAAPPTGGYRIRPYVPKILAPEGSNGEGQKNVKKSAALLRFLAFLALDHPFGVLRGEQPLSRASRAIGSSGTFFGSFWGSKRNTYRRQPIIKGSRRKVAASGAREPCRKPQNILHPPPKKVIIT